MQLIALVSTTITPFHLTEQQARDARKTKRPEHEWRSTIEAGQTYDVPEPIATQWVTLGIAKPADPAAPQPDPAAVEAQQKANDGQAFADHALNIQHPELVDEGRKAVTARIKRSLAEVAQAAPEAPAETPAQ